MTDDITDVPTKWNNTTVVYDTKYKWMPYKHDQDESWVTIPCTECSKNFYGGKNGVIVLNLHKILFHSGGVN